MSKKKPVKSKNKNSHGIAKAVSSKYNDLNMKVKANLEAMGIDPTKKRFIENPDKIKMSAVILEIVDPYLKLYEGNEIRIRKIISLAISIWNMSLLPQKEQIALENQLINQIVPEGGDAKDVAAMIQLIEALKERKRKISHGIRKYIVGYELSINHQSINLQISSQPLKEEASLNK